MKTKLVEVHPLPTVVDPSLRSFFALCLVAFLNDVAATTGADGVTADDTAVAVEKDESTPALPPLQRLYAWLASLDETIALHLPAAAVEALASIDAAVEAHTGVPHASAWLLALLATSTAAILLSAVLGRVFGVARGGAGGRARRRTVLLVGPCGGGKTALCYRLAHGGYPRTVTSMKLQEYPYQPLGKDGTTAAGAAITLVDFPGHERLRGGLRVELKRAAAVIFVVDGTDAAAQLRPAGELLHDLLCDPAAAKWRGLLLLAAKAEPPGSAAAGGSRGGGVRPARLKAALTAELDKLRATRGTLLAQDDDGGGTGAGEGSCGFVPLGRPGVPLDLDVDAPCPVAVATCSAMAGGAALEEVTAFLAANFR